MHPGAVDASGVGMGGVWLHAEQHNRPLLWRQRFPAAIIRRLVSADNPSGNLTNSDFEQMGAVCQQDILAQVYDIREHTVCSFADNTAALSRETRGSTSVDEPSSYLCRLSSLHQRAYRYRLRLAHIPGPANGMADLLSRRWECDDDTLLTHFDTHFPQELPWQLCQLRPNMLSAAISSLSKQRCDPASLLDETPLRLRMSGSGRPSVKIFGVRVRNCQHSASGNSVRSGTVADALQFVSQTFTLVGRPDPRHITGTTAIDT
jgi:hypothetical protein